MENIITYIIVGIVSVLVVNFLNKYASSKPIKDKGYTILIIPKIYMFVGYFGTLLFIIILVSLSITEEYNSSMIPYYLICLFFIGGSIWTLFTYYNYQVIFDESKISSTNIFRKTTELKWEKISKISYNPLSSMIILSAETGEKVKMHQHLKGIKIVLDKVKKMNLKTGRMKIPNYN